MNIIKTLLCQGIDNNWKIHTIQIEFEYLGGKIIYVDFLYFNFLINKRSPYK